MMDMDQSLMFGFIKTQNEFQYKTLILLQDDQVDKAQEFSLLQL